MSADLSIFRFDGADVRIATLDGSPAVVLSDLARILGYRSASDAGRMLRDHHKGYANVRTPGGTQSMVVVTESGMNRLVMRSNASNAETVQDWLADDVMPSIRRTGSYVTQESPEQLMARALVTAQGVIERKDEQIAALAPRAEAWDDLASAEGDYSVADAASILNRAGIETGPQRLFTKLGDIGWIYRGEARRWRPYAKTIDAGYMSERAMPPRVDHDGILQPVAPQVRITARGLERLRVRLGVLSAVEVAS